MKRILMLLAGCILIASCTSQPKHPILDSEKPLAVWMAESEMTRMPSPAQIDFIPVGKIKWNYTSGLELLAMMEAAKEYDRPDFDVYALRYYDSIVQPDGSVISYTKERYNIDHICPGRPLFEIYEKTGEERYLKVMQTLWEQLHEHPRNPDGGFWHKQVYTRQMWLDGIYMGQPYYAEYVMRNVMPNDEEKGKAYVTDIVNQFTTIARHTYDPATGLFRHAYDDAREQFWCDKETGQSAHAWGRAMGWYTMAIVETLQYLGVTEQTQPMITILEHIFNTLPKYANPESGMWYQVCDSPTREGNYEESTGSIMFIYTMMKSARLGYLPAEYQAKGAKLFEQFVDRFVKLEEDGTISITDCCAVAGLGGSGMRSGTYDYYLSEPIRDNDPKATGPFIWAAMEYDRAQQK
ncbi:MAG: glycoside hydrolase family 88 protein [Rikenellaceae bacterium]|nr:glycoside hydrolase family 88 protein [Rikenellaceae bacterium]